MASGPSQILEDGRKVSISGRDWIREITDFLVLRWSDDYECYVDCKRTIPSGSSSDKQYIGGGMRAYISVF